MPESHVVLAVDAVGSSTADSGRLDQLKSTVESCTESALNSVALSMRSASAPRETGDGVLLAYPERHASRVTDAVFHLDHIVRWHNRSSRHTLRLRVAIHCGPIVLAERYHRPYIQATRLLTAPAFTTAVRAGADTDPTGDKLGAALIVSPWIWDYVVAPFRAPLIPPGRCAPVAIDVPGYTGDAWIHLPGLDADTILAAHTDAPAYPATVTNRGPAPLLRPVHIAEETSFTAAPWGGSGE